MLVIWRCCWVTTTCSSPRGGRVSCHSRSAGRGRVRRQRRRHGREDSGEADRSRRSAFLRASRRLLRVAGGVDRRAGCVCRFQSGNGDCRLACRRPPGSRARGPGTSPLAFRPPRSTLSFSRLFRSGVLHPARPSHRTPWPTPGTLRCSAPWCWSWWGCSGAHWDGPGRSPESDSD